MDKSDTNTIPHVDRLTEETVNKARAYLVRLNKPTIPPYIDDTVNNFDKPLSKFFEHTDLRADCSHNQLKMVCEDAIQLNVFSVCVPPVWVADASKFLHTSDVRLCSVVGFPLGYSSTASKVNETRELRENGCQEFDVVLPIAKLLSEDIGYVYSDIASVVSAASGHVVKVILETALLSPHMIILGSVIAMCAGASYLKTSTGFSSAGATISNIRLLRRVVGDRMGIKAAGGIRSHAFAQEAIAAGADRIGCSKTPEILNEDKK